jgi:hypothetical protein
MANHFTSRHQTEERYIKFSLGFLQSNVFLVFLVRKNDGQVTAKLGDFGLGVILFEGVVQPSYAGTNQYIPPVRTLSYRSTYFCAQQFTGNNSVFTSLEH